MNPLIPLPQDLEEVPAWLMRLSSWANAQIVATAGPNWRLSAAYGLLIVLLFIAASSIFVILQREHDS
jgi:hypothetical protein